MEVYLMQHGEATSEHDDPDRPLTPAGRDAVERVAQRARVVGVRLDRCVHSGKVRAQQTAELLASAVGPASIEKRDDLSPNDDVTSIAAWVRGLTDESVAVVGHLPFLDRLAALLVTGDEEPSVVAFRMGGLVTLVPQEQREGFVVAWVLTPELA